MPDVTLAAHFEDLPKQAHAARLGMWTFLASELMLFAGLFALYAAYRTGYPAEFREAARRANLAIGTINTYVLVTSSFFAAMSVAAVRRGRNAAAGGLLFATVALGLAFAALKGVEYSRHFAEGIAPGAFYRFAELPARGARIFFTLYFVMTGLHALHVLAGAAILAWIGGRALRGAYGPERHEHTGLELGTLYWHLVDLIWLFLWPMFYLLRA